MLSRYIRQFGLLLLIAGPAFAQDTGTISGIVTDTSGGRVPAATITVREVGTGLTQSIRTGSDGVYTLFFLPVGNYDLSAEKSGFKKVEITNIRVDVNSTVSENVEMAVGAVTQKVEVTAVAPLVEQTGTNLGKTVPTQAIMDLPLSITGDAMSATGIRSALAFAALTPGVLGDLNQPYTIRIGGGMIIGESYQLDGAEAQSARRNDPQMYGISIEAIDEFKVQASSYSAEYGRSSNGLINFSTKSGTNQLHGDWFTFGRNEAFNARGFTFTPTPRPVVRQWNYGGTVGGPVYIPHVYDGRNKMFFFFGFESYYLRQGPSNTLGTVPTAAMLRGDFSGYVNASGQMIPIYDPFDANGNIITNAADRVQFPGNIIPPSMIDPTASLLMSALPPPDEPNLISDNYLDRNGLGQYAHVPSIKADYIISERNRMSFFYSRYFQPAQFKPPIYAGVPPGDNNNNALSWTYLSPYYRINEDFVINPRLLNHITLGYSTRVQVEGPYSVLKQDLSWLSNPNLPQETYVKGNPVPYTPGIMTTFRTGTVNWFYAVHDTSPQRTTEVKEELAWLNGRHSLKFGFDFLRGQYRRINCVFCWGWLTATPASTANPSVSGPSGYDIASLMLGLIGSGITTFPGDITMEWPYYAWYVQDDFKVSRRLTLNFGLRYELPKPKYERDDHWINFCPSCPNPDAGGLLGGIIAERGHSSFGELRKDALGPRLGIAYQLNPKTTIRAGASIYYQPVREDGNSSEGTQPWGGYWVTPGNYFSSGIAMQLKTGFLPYASQLALAAPPITDLNSVALFSTPSWYQPSAGKTPYFGDWNFTVERTFDKASLLRVSYHATRGIHLLTDDQNPDQLDPKYISIYGSLLSEPLSTVLSTSAPLLAANGFKLPFTSCTAPGCLYSSYPLSLTLSQALTPFPQYSSISADTGGAGDGHMEYDALEASFEHRFTGGLYMMAVYNFSKTIDDAASENSDYMTEVSAQNYYDRRADKSVSALDSTHCIRLSYVYQLPVGSGKRYLKRMPKPAQFLIGNWRLAAIQTYISGTPMSITCGQNMYGAGGTTRCSFAPGAGTTIPLKNPAWSSNPTVAYYGYSPDAVPYINPAAVVYPANGTYGNMPRYISNLRNPWLPVNEDVSLIKNFHIDEQRSIEFRVSGLDAFNRHVLPGPNTAWGSATSGYITEPQANVPRSVQFAAKFIF